MGSSLVGTSGRTRRWRRSFRHIHPSYTSWDRARLRPRWKTTCKTISSSVTRRVTSAGAARPRQRETDRVPPCITYLPNIVFWFPSRLRFLPAGSRGSLPSGLLSRVKLCASKIGQISFVSLARAT